MADDKQEQEQQQSLEQVASRLAESNRNQIAEMAQMKQELNVLKEIAEAVMDIRRMYAMQLLEGGREISGAGEVAEVEKVPSTVEQNMKLETPSNLREILAAFAGLVVGFIGEIGAVFGGLIKFFKEEEVIVLIGKFFKNLRTAFGSEGALGEVIGGMKGFFKRFANLFKSEGKIGSIFLSEGTLLNQTGEAITKAFRTIRSYFGMFAETMGALGESIAVFIKESSVVKSFTSAFETIAELFKGLKVTMGSSKLTKIFNPLKAVFESFVTVGSKIGKVFGSLLPPALVVLEIWEMVKESFNFVGDEMEKGGNFIQRAIAGIVGAFTGFVNFFLMIPDMIKGLISWIAEKLFGPENPVTQFLDSFSFVEMFTDLMKGIVQFLNHDLPEALVAGWNKLSEWFDSFTTSITEDFFGSIDKIFEWIGGVVDSVVETFTTAWNAMKDFSLFETIDNALQVLSKAIKDVFGWLGGLITKIKDKIFFWKKKEEDEDPANEKNDKNQIPDTVKDPDLGFNERRTERKKLQERGVIQQNYKGDVTSFDEKKVMSLGTEDLMRLKSAAAGSNEELDEGIVKIIQEREALKVSIQKWVTKGFHPDIAAHAMQLVDMGRNPMKNKMVYEEMARLKKMEKKDPEKLETEDAPQLQTQEPEKVGTGNVASAMNPAPETPLVLNEAGNAGKIAPQVVGTAQEAESLSREMTDYQRILNDNRSTVNNNNSASSANVGVDASSTVINNNTTIRSAGMAPTYDVTDRMGYQGSGVPYRR